MTQESVVYQGHHPDGSGIQKHSAGGLYPCVVYTQDVTFTPNPSLGLQKTITLHGVLRGSYDSGAAFDYDEAVEHAEALNEAAALVARWDRGDWATREQIRAVVVNLFRNQPVGASLTAHDELKRALHLMNGGASTDTGIRALKYMLWGKQE